MKEEKAKKRRIAPPHLISVAYFIAGISLIIAASQSKYIPIHASLIGVLNIIASCEIYKKRKWSFYVLAFISIISLVFGFILLAAIICIFRYDILDILALMSATSYTCVFIASLAYMAMQKDKFT